MQGIQVNNHNAETRYVIINQMKNSDVKTIALLVNRKLANIIVRIPGQLHTH